MKKLTKIAGIIPLGFGICCLAQGTLADWVPVNSPEAGYIGVFAVNPLNPAEMYAATGGLYKSMDGGASWAPIETGLTGVTAIGIDPEIPSTLYLEGASYGAQRAEQVIKKSTNSGLTWMPITAGLEVLGSFYPNLGYPSCSNFQFTHQSIVYFACLRDNPPHGLAFQALKPDDFWRGIPLPVDVNNPKTGHFLLKALTVTPTPPETLFADFSTYFGGERKLGVHRSMDGGITWQVAHQGLGKPVIHQLRADPLLAGTVYALSNKGLFKTDNAGVRWRRIFNQGGTVAMATHAFNPDTLYAGTERGIFKTQDGGRLWSKVNSLKPTYLATDRVSPGNIYAATVAGVFVSQDAGHTWQSKNYGLPGAPIFDLAQNNTNPLERYAITTSSIFKSTDGGRYWAPAKLFKRGIYNARLAISPTQGQKVYALVNNNLYKTADSAATWKTILSPQETSHSIYGQSLDAFAIDPFHKGTIYAAINRMWFSQMADGYDKTWIKKSTDDGRSWRKIFTGKNMGITEIVVDPHHPSVLYAASNGPMPSPYCDDVSYDVSCKPAVLQSMDGGAHWTISVLPKNSMGILRLVVGDSSTSTVYAAGTEGVYRKTQSEAAWTAIYTAPVLDMTIDPQNAKHLYVRTPESVIWSSNEGATWQALQAGLPTATNEPPYLGFSGAGRALWMDSSTNPVKLLTQMQGVLYENGVP